jgi:hypothetical protein
MGMAAAAAKAEAAVMPKNKRRNGNVAAWPMAKSMKYRLNVKGEKAAERLMAINESWLSENEKLETALAGSRRRRATGAGPGVVESAVIWRSAAAIALAYGSVAKLASVSPSLVLSALSCEAVEHFWAFQNLGSLCGSAVTFCSVAQSASL